MKTLLLYGAIGNQFGKIHHYEVSSPAEAVKALSVTLKGFKKVFAEGYYRILIGGKTDLDISETANPVSDKETIRIVPVIAGANSGPLKIIAGAALIVVGAVTLFAPAVNLGTALIIGGVSEMLFPPPSAAGDSQERPENKPSFIFNGAINTTRQGNPVPICYGRMIVGSQVISAGLSVESI